MTSWALPLVGRRAVVAGGGGGLGSAIVRALAEAGCAVVVLGRSASTVDLADTLSAQGHTVYGLSVDLARRDALADAFDQSVDLLGGLDILVAAQGIALPGPALDYDLDDWDATLEVNLTSVFELCQRAARVMVPQGSGRIVTVASMLSFSGGLNAAAYAASKGGVSQLTKALANEWASSGVNVNSVAPGYIRTQANRHIWNDNPAREAEITARLPAGRWGEPEDIADPVVFLCSDAARYLHGVVLPVDGGWLSR